MYRLLLMSFKKFAIILGVYLAILLLGSTKPKPVPGPTWDKPVDPLKLVLGYDYAKDEWRYHSESKEPTQVIKLPKNTTLEELIMYDNEYYFEHE